MTVTQTVTVSYVVPQSSLVTILKELAKVKQINWQLKKNAQMVPKQSTALQPAVS